MCRHKLSIVGIMLIFQECDMKERNAKKIADGL